MTIISIFSYVSLLPRLSLFSDPRKKNDVFAIFYMVSYENLGKNSLESDSSAYTVKVHQFTTVLKFSPSLSFSDYFLIRNRVQKV